MVKFATRMNNLKGSAIRELLALANKPEILSFAGGMPAPELFPVEKMKAATDAVLDEMGEVALQYTSTDGWPRLREADQPGRSPAAQRDFGRDYRIAQGLPPGLHALPFGYHRFDREIRGGDPASEVVGSGR